MAELLSSKGNELLKVINLYPEEKMFSIIQAIRYLEKKGNSTSKAITILEKDYAIPVFDLFRALNCYRKKSYELNRIVECLKKRKIGLYDLAKFLHDYYYPGESLWVPLSALLNELFHPSLGELFRVIHNISPELKLFHNCDLPHELSLEKILSDRFFYSNQLSVEDFEKQFNESVVMVTMQRKREARKHYAKTRERRKTLKFLVYSKIETSRSFAHTGQS
jgi:hypothetical protein